MDGPLPLDALLFPDRDAGFGRVIDRLSRSPTGPAGADNLVTNEDSVPRIAGEIAAQVPPDQGYLGVGPDQNFTYIAHSRPALSVIVDYRRKNRLLHLLHKAFFALSPTRADYLRHLTAMHPRVKVGVDSTAESLIAAFDHDGHARSAAAESRREVERYLEPLGLISEPADRAEIERIRVRLAGPGLRARFLALPGYPTTARMMTTVDRGGRPAHFLADESFYRRVRERQLGDVVLPIVDDFGAADGLSRLATQLGRRGPEIGLAYFSDVEFFLFRAGRFPAFIANLRRLPWHRNARVVRSSTKPIDHAERVAGDSSTTILRPAREFLDRAAAGGFRRWDDLFA